MLTTDGITVGLDYTNTNGPDSTLIKRSVLMLSNLKGHITYRLHIHLMSSSNVVTKIRSLSETKQSCEAHSELH